MMMLPSCPATASSLPISQIPKMASSAVFTASWLSTIHCSASLSFTRMSPIADVSGSSLSFSSMPTSLMMWMLSRMISPSFVKKFSTLVRIFCSAASFSASSVAFM